MSVNVAATNKAASTYHASAGTPYIKSCGSGWLFSQLNPAHRTNANNAGTAIEAALPVRAVVSADRKVSSRSDWRSHDGRDAAGGEALSAGGVAGSGSIMLSVSMEHSGDAALDGGAYQPAPGSDCRFSHT